MSILGGFIDAKDTKMGPVGVLPPPAEDGWVEYGGFIAYHWAAAYHYNGVRLGGPGQDLQSLGALALQQAPLWMHGLAWQDAHPDKQPGIRSSKADKRSLAIFSEATGDVFECRKICGREFASLDEHSAYLEAGGCAELIDALARS